MHAVVTEPARSAPAEDRDPLADAECNSNVGGGLFDGIDFSGCHHESSRRCQAADGAQVARAEPAAFARCRGHEPQLLSNLALHWPALARWSDPTVLSALIELSDSPGTDVLVLRSQSEGRFLKSDCLQERWPPARVVRHLFSSPAHAAGSAAGAENQATETLLADSIYARAPLTERALADCDLQALEAMMGQPAQVANCGVWIGSASNITPFHYDLCHGFLVQVLGTKTFTFVEVKRERERA
jgi:hypothetical protein